MTAGFICASPVFEAQNGRLYVRSYEYLSILQWLEPFSKVYLFWQLAPKTQNVYDWVQLESDKIEFVPICEYGEKLNETFFDLCKVHIEQYKCDILYYRIPSIDTTVLWMMNHKCSPYFVEIHGDINIMDKLGRAKQKLLKLWEKILHKMVKNSLCVFSIGPELAKKYSSPIIPTLVTTNHLTKESLYPVNCPRKKLQSPIKILFVGALEERKGLTFLFQALKRLNDDRFDFEMILAGQGGQKDLLQKYAYENGFGNRVNFLGQVKHGEALYDLYKQCDLFVLPSISSEGVPRVTHEAMIFGCPVVATDIGSLKWQLEGGAGIVLQPGNVDELYDAILRVGSDENLRNSLVQNGYKRSLEYTWEKQKERNLNFLNEQLARIK